MYRTFSVFTVYRDRYSKVSRFLYWSYTGEGAPVGHGGLSLIKMSNGIFRIIPKKMEGGGGRMFIWSLTRDDARFVSFVCKYDI